ncbi:hypothetical protein ACS3QZ_01275 [Shimia sp. W99]
MDLAARLCGKTGPWSVLVDRATSDLANDDLVISEHPPVKLKGYTNPVPVFLADFHG